MKVDKISHGATFEGKSSTVGLIFTIIGIIFTVTNFKSDDSIVLVPIGLLTFIVGLIFFISVQGILIDVERRQVKPYFNIFIAKIGKWQPLDSYNRITLSYSSISQTMNSRGNTSDLLTRLFSIRFSNDNKKEILIKEFVDYDEAKSFLEEFSEKLKMEMQNTYEILKEQIQERKQDIRK